MNELTDNKIVVNESRFMLLVNNLPDSISQLDEKFRYTFVNKTILELTGAPESFFVGRTIYELGFPEAFIKEQEAYLKIAFEKGVTSTFEAISELPQIGPRTFHITIIPVWNTTRDKVESVLNIAKDITLQKEFENELSENIFELKELSENLSNKNRQLQDFAYIVSHNLRSPMNNLVALKGLYESEDSADQKAFIFQKIGEVIRSFSTTIEELTEVVKKKEDNGMEFQTKSFKEVVEHLKIILNTQIESSKASIVYDFDACETIRYPKVYLESILMNLITNSIKYRSDKRPLEIILSTSIEDGIVTFVCKDNGLGLDLNKYGHQIFGMKKTFHPISDSRGMGLFITKNQIESLGGSISVESEIDKGATFSVVFS